MYLCIALKAKYIKHLNAVDISILYTSQQANTQQHSGFKDRENVTVNYPCFACVYKDNTYSLSKCPDKKLFTLLSRQNAIFKSYLDAIWPSRPEQRYCGTFSCECALG